MYSKRDDGPEVFPDGENTALTMRSNLQAAQAMEHIFNAQALRAISLSGLANDGLPVLEYQFNSQISAALIGQIFDPGRANSFCKNSSAIFNDPYHREALFCEESYVSLTVMSCVAQTQHPSCLGVAVFSDLLPFVRRYLDVRRTPYVVYTSNVHLQYLGLTEQVCMLLFQAKDMKEVLHSIGMLGAFPNRDRQLKYYIKNFKNSEHMRDAFFTIMATLYNAKFPRSYLEIKDTLQVCNSPQDLKNTTLSLLQLQARNYLPGIMPEQRLFYNQLLAKLIASLEFDPNNYNLEHRIQSALALSRIETMLLGVNNLTYEGFLRTIEACIDEIIILLILQHSQKPDTSLQVSNSLQQFVTETVGIQPQMATLRSSAMQAIWSSLQMALDFFEMQTRSQPLNVNVSETIYFEVAQVLRILFKIANFEIEKELRLQLNADYTSEKIYDDANTIYDLYISNFEANVLFTKTQPQFVDINSFIENQLNLRQVSGLGTVRPLIVILDNTMSNVYEIYLLILLQQFKEEINAGLLCILVAYSGNKYLQLGTDKVLAGLLYGYYNPQVFSKIHQCFEQELAANKLGDFDANSPTVLLTQSYLSYGRSEVMAFGPLLRARTYYLFLYAIPADLVNNPGYYTIDRPMSNARYKLSSPNCSDLERSSCFITIRCHSQNYNTYTYSDNRDNHSIFFDNLAFLLSSLGFGPRRDGFSFDQTTWAEFSFEKIVRGVRISIGTESLESIGFALQKLCSHLMQVNAFMKDHMFDNKQGGTNPLQAYTLFNNNNKSSQLPTAEPALNCPVQSCQI